VSAKSRWEQYKEKNNGVTFLDVFNPNVEHANEEKSQKRFSICEECPELIKLTSQCKKCGCFMKMKVKIQNAACPLGKW